MDQLQIFVIVLNSASILLRFLLTRFKISACRLEERNKDKILMKDKNKFCKDKMLVSKGNTKMKIFRITRFSFLLQQHTLLQQSN